MARAKDLISEDQWTAAIRCCAPRPETRRTEQGRGPVLAGAQPESRPAIWPKPSSIRALQRDFPKSRWSEPAGSLMIELAHKLGRSDVLWKAATPQATGAPRGPARAVGSAVAPIPERADRDATGTTAAPWLPPPRSRPRRSRRQLAWFADSYALGADLRVQALGQLIKTDAQKVIPILRNIALGHQSGAAREAVSCSRSRASAAARVHGRGRREDRAGAGARRRDSRTGTLRRSRSLERAARCIRPAVIPVEAASRRVARRTTRMPRRMLDRPVRERRSAPRHGNHHPGMVGGREQLRPCSRAPRKRPGWRSFAACSSRAMTMG